MSADRLHDLLKHADEQLQARRDTACDSTCATGFASADLIQSIRRRSRRKRRRTGLGVLAILVLIGSVAAWSSHVGVWGRGDVSSEVVAINTPRDDRPAPTTAGGARRRLRDDEVARLRAEIAALDAEAQSAGRFVELYRAAEVRGERLANAEIAMGAPLLSPRALADLEIDRAAAITVIAADAQANTFNRPTDAADSYRSVLAHFPDSHWATVARARLEEIERM